MDTKEKHIRENEPHREEARDNQQAREILANGKNRKRNSTNRTNRIWLWLGVIILIFILFWWIFTCGIYEDIVGFING